MILRLWYYDDGHHHHYAILQKGFLMQNLRFGNSFRHTPLEIWQLCKLLGMSDRVLYHPPDRARPRRSAWFALE
eukprot:gene11182-biopygen9325